MDRARRTTRLVINGTGNARNGTLTFTSVTREVHRSVSPPDLFWALDDYEQSRTQGQATRSFTIPVEVNLEQAEPWEEPQEARGQGHDALLQQLDGLREVATCLQEGVTKTNKNHEEKLHQLEIVNRNQNETILRLEKNQLDQQNLITTLTETINQMKKSWSEVGDTVRSQNEAMTRHWQSLLQEFEDKVYVQSEKIARLQNHVTELEEVIQAQNRLIANQEQSLLRVQLGVQDEIKVFIQHQSTQRELESSVQTQAVKLQQVENSLRGLGELITNQEQSLSELKREVRAQGQRLTQPEGAPLKNESIEEANDIVQALSSPLEDLYELKRLVEQQKGIIKNLATMAGEDHCIIRTHTKDIDYLKTYLSNVRKYCNTQTEAINQNKISLCKINERIRHLEGCENKDDRTVEKKDTEKLGKKEGRTDDNYWVFD